MLREHAEDLLQGALVKLALRWKHGDLAVRSAYGHSLNVSGMQFVAVVDVRSGTVVRMLHLGRDRWKDCCEVLGWLDAETVVLRNSPHTFLAWNFVKGGIGQVTGPFNGSVSVATTPGR